MRSRVKLAILGLATGLLGVAIDVPGLITTDEQERQRARIIESL